MNSFEDIPRRNMTLYASSNALIMNVAISTISLRTNRETNDDSASSWTLPCSSPFSGPLTDFKSVSRIVSDWTFVSRPDRPLCELRTSLVLIKPTKEFVAVVRPWDRYIEPSAREISNQATQRA